MNYKDYMKCDNQKDKGLMVIECIFEIRNYLKELVDGRSGTGELERPEGKVNEQLPRGRGQGGILKTVYGATQRKS